MPSYKTLNFFRKSLAPHPLGLRYATVKDKAQAVISRFHFALIVNPIQVSAIGVAGEAALPPPIFFSGHRPLPQDLTPTRSFKYKFLLFEAIFYEKIDNSRRLLREVFRNCDLVAPRFEKVF